MSFQLLTDCLDEIFEYLEEDRITLHSCLLVNRLWCKISIRILWRNIWKFTYSINNSFRQKAILSTLITCLPNESKEILYNLKVEGPLQKALTSKPPLFNYAAFCKVLSIYHIHIIINDVFDTDDLYNPITNEIIKMFMNQSSSLKKLIHYSYRNISFIYFPGARNRLENLSELCCNSNTYSEFFYQLSQICHNLQSLSLEITENKTSDGLKRLISSQNNLKNLNLFSHYGIGLTDISIAIAEHYNTLNTLSRLHIYTYNDNSCNDLLSLLVALCSNLQEIKFSFTEKILKDFEELQNITFPKLKILKIPHQGPEPKCMMKFLENNGEYLKELHIDENNDSLGLSIAKFCPNLKKLSIKFNNNELDILKTIFNSCQYLESIKVWCGNEYLNEKEVLEVVAIHSPKNFCELKIFFNLDILPELFSKNLELFLINWKNRPSKKLITLIIMKFDKYLLNEENIKIIEKYKNLGIIKKYEIKGFYDELDEEKDNDRF